MDDRVADALERFEPVDLEEVEERAALQQRVDRKYFVPVDVWLEVLEELREDHQAMVASDVRLSGYETIYFDTPDLRAYREHVEGARPRFKVRSRLYVDGGKSVFELKVKNDDDETVKEHREGDDHDFGELTDDVRAFLADKLGELTGQELPDDLRHTLTTRFRRGTLVERDGAQRVTFDVDLELAAPDDRSVRLDDGVVLVETKSEGDDGRADQLLADRGIEEVSMSKYRTGVGLLVADEPDDDSRAVADRFA